MVEGELDPFDFLLAENLGLSLQAIRGMPNNEYLQWRAFYTWRAAQAELETTSRGGALDGN